jgi:rhamnose transport system ATP-binding protein
VTPIVELRGISKRFGPVEVLADVDLAIYSGQVHSLAGENGAGKSTLVKILAGIHQPDRGHIFKDGKEIDLFSATDAQRNGIAVVHQHPALFPDLSVAENIFVGRQPRNRGRVDWSSMNAKARDMLERLRMRIDVRLPVKMLTVAERQSIEIARALSFDARVLVLDEPTSVISGLELERLYEIVLHLKQQGVALLFISHFLDEVLGWGDQVTILRSGKRVTTQPTAGLSIEQTVRYMIGTEPASFFPKEEAQIGEPVLGVRRLSGAVFVEDVSFVLRAGEILGFFGLVGAGRSEIAEMLFGISRPDRGEIRIDGKAVDIHSPRDAMRLGIAFLPEDRHQQGLVLQFPIRANETLPILRQLCSSIGLIDIARERQLADHFAKRVRVIATGVEQLTGTLSGGNQQKVLLAKWLMPKPRIIILDQPTRGIDVGAKAEIHRIVSHLATEGIAVILIGDDAEEVMAMADRILVFRGGRITAETQRGNFDREAILLAAAHGAQDQTGVYAA